MREQRTVWFWICEHKDCGWKWLADGLCAPEKCAKCKRRGWHTKNAPIALEPVEPVIPVEEHEELPIGKPDLEALVSGIMEKPFEVQTTYAPDVPVCGRYKWDERIGQGYTCGKPKHNLKYPCGNFVEVDA